MRILLSTLFICCVVGCISEEPEARDLADDESGDEIDAPSAEGELGSADEGDAGTSEVDPSSPGVAVAGPWSTFPLICRGCGRRGNLVQLWQSVLWADGAKKGNGDDFGTLDIDGVFGRDTEAATKSWQSSWLPDDRTGKVGTNTWREGGSALQIVDDFCQGGVYRYIYRGATGATFALTQSCITLEWKFFHPRTGILTDTTYF